MNVTAWLPGIVVGVILAAAGGIWAIVNRRGGDRFRAKNPLPPTWPEMWARMEEQDHKIEALEAKGAELEARMEDRDRAMVNILTDAATQWPPGVEGPYFNKADVDILEDTLPAGWKRRIRPQRA